MTEKFLSPIVCGKELQTEIRWRRSPYIYKTVTANNNELLKKKVEIERVEGWQVIRKNKKSVRVGKLKPADELCEDQVWTIFAQMGFHELSKGRHFKIKVSDTTTPRQIDVFAKDDETALVVECTQTEKPSTKSMDVVINKIVSLKNQITTSINKHYEPSQKLKVGFVIATKNINWRPVDKKKCQEQGISIIADDEIQYYERLVKHLKSAARYQLLAHLFAGSRISGLTKKVLATRAKMGGEFFYTFLISPDELLKIAYIGHRSSRNIDNIETYQRMLQPIRLKNIANYINDGGIFPTNIVLNLKKVKKRQLVFEKKESLGNETLGTLSLPDTYASAWVIDGQHRLYGYAYAREKPGFNNDLSSIPVLAYENLPPEREQELFIDINSKQVKVPTALLVELYSNLHWESEDIGQAHLAVLSRLVAQLNSEHGSPFFDRVSITGKSKTPSRCLTPTSLRDGLIHARLLGAVSTGQMSPGPLSTDNMKNHNANLDKAKVIISGLVELFAKTNRQHWDLGAGQGGYLATNNGVRALFHVIYDLSKHIETIKDLEFYRLSAEEAIGLLTPYLQTLANFFQSASAEEILQFRKSGSSLVVVRQHSYRMESHIREKHPKFNPVGLQHYLDSLDVEGTKDAANKILELHKKLYEYVVTTLKKHFGSSEDEWWVNGIPLKIRIECASLWEEKNRDGEVHSTLYLSHYETICKYGQNWEIFKDVISLDEKDKKNKNKNSKWIWELNNLRQITAHPERGPLNKIQVSRVNEIYNKVQQYFPT